MRFTLKLIFTWLLNIILGSIANIWVILILDGSIYKPQYIQNGSDWFTIFIGCTLFSSVLSLLLLFPLFALYAVAKSRNASVHKYLVWTYWISTIVFGSCISLVYGLTMLHFLVAYIFLAIPLFWLILKVQLFNFWKK